MDAGGYFRLILPYIIEMVIFIGFTWLVVYFIKRWKVSTSLWVKRGGILATAFFLMMFVVLVATSYANYIPRSSINRNNLDRQNQQWEQQHLAPSPTK